MPIEDQIKDAQEALVNAHNAGDEDAARKIADHIVSLQGQKETAAPELADRTIGDVAGGAVGAIGGAALGRSLQSGIREEYPKLFKGVPETAAPKGGIPNVTVTGSPASPKTGGENWVKTLTGADIPDAQMSKKDLDIAKGMRETVGRGGPLAGGKITESGIMVGPKAAAEMAKEAQAVKEAAAAANAPSLFGKAKEAAAAVNRNAGHVLHGMTNPWAIKTLGNALAGAGVGMQGMDAYQRYQDPNQGIIRSAISGLGALGSGAAMTRVPALMLPGIAAGTAAPFINEYLDEWAKKHPEAAKRLHLADGGSVSDLDVSQLEHPLKKRLRNAQLFINPIDEKYVKGIAGRVGYGTEVGDQGYLNAGLTGSAARMLFPETNPITRGNIAGVDLSYSPSPAHTFSAGYQSQAPASMPMYGAPSSAEMPMTQADMIGRGMNAGMPIMAKDRFNIGYRHNFADGGMVSDKELMRMIRATKMPRTTNIQSQPGRYLTAQQPNVQFVPREYLGEPGVNAMYQPSTNTVSMERRPGGLSSQDLGSLAHEFQHHKDTIAPQNPMNVRPEDEGLLRGIQGGLNRYTGQILDANRMPVDAQARGALTQQEGIKEVLPQLAGYEASLPAGMNLMQSGLGRMLTPQQKAMVMRRMNPLPKGVDAMVGGYAKGGVVPPHLEHQQKSKK